MGCMDSSISSRTELYDLLVNLPAREITVANHAKGKCVPQLIKLIVYLFKHTCIAIQNEYYSLSLIIFQKA